MILINTNIQACIALSDKIKGVKEEISALNKLVLSGKKQFQPKLREKEQERLNLESQYIQINCDNRVETKKLVENAQILRTQFNQSDEDVLEKSRKEQNTLYFVGGGVILLGLFVILRL